MFHAVAVSALQPSPVCNDAFDLAFWDSIRTSREPADFEAYLNDVPCVRFRTLARNRLAALRAQPSPSSPTPPVPAPTTVPPLALAAQRAPDPSPPPRTPDPAPQPRLALAPPAPPSPQPLSRDEIAEAQRLLGRLGFDTGGTSGSIGPRSRTALRQFALAEALPTTTDFTADLFPRLQRAAEVFQRLVARGPNSPRGVNAASISGGEALYGRGWAAEQASPPDYREAVYWYGLAVQARETRAFLQLGLLLARGQGIPAPDYAGSTMLWRLIAARGDATAAFNLGAMFERGICAAPNRQEARAWYAQAAEAGSAPARAALQRLSL